MRASWLDRALILLFIFAALVAYVYEPLFFLKCGWSGLALGDAGICSQSWVGRAWLDYLQVEPYYAKAPLWLQLVNEFDTLMFGWFYVLSAVVFIRGLQTRSWYRVLAVFMSGMMTYAMAFYLAWEALSFRETGAKLGAVIAYNGLWIFIFALLLIRLYLDRATARPSTGVRRPPPSAAGKRHLSILNS
ncbi:MAG: hypothetical protein JWR16_1926 [Nevskia sp.]|nr:hypothetical protein [Nevskia sp.]